ncbi:hypothetical protein IWQ62_003767 [Dispira parvispora]|uniref:CCHC-type domain-containing protein n=1 Tax=Dispira parvispora TaxID=1520584 RepID=A0A9W8E605_9FUNG|nr:hypothetical protein IWQ62_003767 [Dispira parvispora]
MDDDAWNTYLATVDGLDPDHHSDASSNHSYDSAGLDSAEEDDLIGRLYYQVTSTDSKGTKPLPESTSTPSKSPLTSKDTNTNASLLSPHIVPNGKSTTAIAINGGEAPSTTESGHESHTGSPTIVPSASSIIEQDIILDTRPSMHTESPTADETVSSPRSDTQDSLDLSDVESVNGTEARYFLEPKKFLCRSCGEEGHAWKDCPNQKCRVCGEVGHKAIDCSFNKEKCYRCNLRGHLARDCPAKHAASKCETCYSRFHHQSECPLTWRRYTYTDSDDKTSRKLPKLKPRPYCYNCAKAGHWGDDCPSRPLSHWAYRETTAFNRSNELGEASRRAMMRNHQDTPQSHDNSYRPSKRSKRHHDSDYDYGDTQYRESTPSRRRHNDREDSRRSTKRSKKSSESRRDGDTHIQIKNSSRESPSSSRFHPKSRQDTETERRGSHKYPTRSKAGSSDASSLSQQISSKQARQERRREERRIRKAQRKHGN